MPWLPTIGIWEAQWIISSLIWPFYRWFFYKYQAIFKANADHIDIALEDLEKEIDSITSELLNDYKSKFNIGNDTLDKVLLQITDEGFADKLSWAEIIGPILNMYLFQNKEFLKIKGRMGRSINAFLKAYKEWYFQYEKGSPNGVLLVNDQKRKFIDICSRSYDEFLELTDILFMEFLQIAAKNPSPDNAFLKMDIGMVHNQLVFMRSNEIKNRYIWALDKFLSRMIELIKL